MRPSPETLAELELAQATMSPLDLKIYLAGHALELLAYIRDLEGDNERFRGALVRALSRNVALAALAALDAGVKA